MQAVFVTDQEASQAWKGQAVTLTLDREIDVSRGCMLVKDTELIVSSMFTAVILWMDDSELTQGKNFLVKIGTKLISAAVMDIKYRIDIHTGEHLAATRLYKNEIAVCDIAAAEEIVYDTFQKHKGAGSFILIDRVTNMTSACGVVEHSLRRSENIVWQKLARKMVRIKMNGLHLNLHLSICRRNLMIVLKSIS